MTSIVRLSKRNSMKTLETISTAKGQDRHMEKQLKRHERPGVLGKGNESARERTRAG